MQTILCALGFAGKMLLHGFVAVLSFRWCSNRLPDKLVSNPFHFRFCKLLHLPGSLTTALFLPDILQAELCGPAGGQPRAADVRGHPEPGGWPG